MYVSIVVEDLDSSESPCLLKVISRPTPRSLNCVLSKGVDAIAFVNYLVFTVVESSMLSQFLIHVVLLILLQSYLDFDSVHCSGKL
jgi:hypothetical protein